jgi:RNA polymerase sigma factor (sigma-70 family)
MRSVIVDTIRQGRAARHGGAQVRVTLNTDVENSVFSAQDEVVRISEALEVLAKTDERLVRLVEMKYFAGLSERDIAESLDISERTLRRDWQKARLLLLAVLK